MQKVLQRSYSITNKYYPRENESHFILFPINSQTPDISN